MTNREIAQSPVTEPCPHCGCPVAPGEWFEDDEGTASCTCCALRDECDPNDPDCTCRREDAIVQESATPTPGVTVEYTYQVVADGDILNDFTKMDDALRYAVGLNPDWRRVEIVRITWEHIRVR